MLFGRNVTFKLLDGFVFENIESAKKFIDEKSFESAEKEPNPSYKGRDI